MREVLFEKLKDIGSHLGGCQEETSRLREAYAAGPGAVESRHLRNEKMPGQAAPTRRMAQLGEDGEAGGPHLRERLTSRGKRRRFILTQHSTAEGLQQL